MGVNLKDFVIKHKIKLEDLKDKKIAIDAFNIIFQFLSSIRQQDGTPLMDSQGNVTSHLVGLFYRAINFLEAGIKPCFVFDGKAPEEKRTVVEAREAIRKNAREKYAKAVESGDVETAKKCAQQTSKLTEGMIQECKELVSALGLPWVQAISDGEAQCSFMCNRGLVWAVASQDYDALLFGTPRLIRNLSISGKKKVAGKDEYISTDIELIDLAETLNFHAMDIVALVNLALLIGTDFNVSGVQGIGPKTALKIIKTGKFDEYKDKIPNYDKLKNIFLKPYTTTDYTLVWKEPDETKLIEILCKRHEFSEERVKTTLKRLEKAKFENKQTGLGSFV